MYVFVYGTLKKNEPNNHWLTNPKNGIAKFICNGKTITKYPLVIASRYNIPFLLDKPQIGKEIHGEVYEIDEEMLRNLDILEEYPKLYTRRVEPIMIYKDDNSSCDKINGFSSGHILEAWTYFLTDFHQDMLSFPFLESYTSTGSHGLPYFARYLRDQLVDHRVEVKVMSSS